MFLLILVLCSSVIGIILVRRKLRKVPMEEDTAFRELGSDYETLLGKSRDLKVQKELLDSEYQNVTLLYEVTKNISKTLNREEVFETFKDILISFMDIEDCSLLTNAESERKDSRLMAGQDYFIFPLKTGAEDIWGLAVKGIRDEDKDKFIILANQFSLVMKRAELYRLIQELSITDNLTQALVKKYSLERLKEEFLRSKRKKLNFSCLMLDVDNFKNFNDRFGHLVGDVILTEVSLIIKDNIREIDLLGRFGGEEFLLALPESNKQEASFVAERIREAVERKSVRAYDEVLKVTVSIGIATFPEDTDNDEDLIDRADQALYQAKQIGKNRICLYGKTR